GFDCGPGNTLLDAWIRRHRSESFDANGAWSAEHEADPSLLESLMQDPFFTKTGPRSTGPELFNLEWLDARLTGDLNPGAVQATLAELTAFSIANSLRGNKQRPEALFVCGGGARNTDLMRRLHDRLNAMNIRLGTTDELGLAAEWVEACAFAWLARRTLKGLPGNAERATGAAGPRVLGAVYPA
ncbi:MAG: anhydro-N-acetylmuramic acid kinase, partial [Congregibacter sp.]|nr:anhydro-N-acetylmuramic acid kinase [Congregibacter sp.]